MPPTHTRPLRDRRASARRQRGVYALEWAAIFIVFFMLLYAILSFGLGFLVREAMQWAAEDGARAALQYQASSQDDRGAVISGRQARKDQARKVVEENLGWLPTELRSALSDDTHFVFEVCRPDDTTSCTTDMVATAPDCDLNNNKPCMVQLRLSLPYARHSFTPTLSLGLMAIAMPDLRANAQIMVDQKGF